MTDPETPGAEAAENQPPAPAPAAGPVTFAQRLAAAYDGLSGRRVDAAELNALREQLAAVTGERDAAQASLAAAQNELAQARTQLAEAEQAVVDFERRVQTASIARVAAAGIPAEDLPAVTGAGEDPGDRLRAELAETTDPRRKGEIAAKLLALRAGKN